MNENMHLTLDERNYIEQELMKNTSFKDIAKCLGKDPSTISREVKKHRIKKEGQSIQVGFNHCARRYNCHRKNICSTRCKKDCKQCKDCNSVCPDFEDGICLRLKRAPFVCNGCSNRFNCRSTKYYYRALPSFNKYKVVLSESRQGINMTELELSNLDKLISPLVKQGQSLSHIYQTHDIPCSRSSLYRYLAQNCFSVGPIDLPRKVRMKKRKERKSEIKDTKARTNRTYEDFQRYIEIHPELPIVEMDIVEGVKGGRVLLTDNGTEFGNPLSLEFNAEGIGRTRIFYCNPRASYQKGMIEKNHEFIRYVLPKGTSFDKLLQTDINLMINHINSLGRNSLNWFAPLDVAKFTMDKEVLKKLNLKKIPTDEIQLNTKLLKKN